MVFLVVLFLIKNATTLKNTVNSLFNNQKSGLSVSGNIPIGNLINKDTDGDGILDWEEPLWGLDPTKKETTPGIPDGTLVNKLKLENGKSVETIDPVTGKKTITTDETTPENLTQTDKFSKELFSTVATLNQGGTLDQTAVDTITTSLNNQMRNSVQRKVFTISDIKVINDNGIKAIKKYNDTMNSIQKKYPDQGSVISVLQKFIIDENNVDISALAGLDPIIKNTQNIIDEIIKIEVPQSLSQLHLNLLNAGEKLVENISDIKLFDTDPIVTAGAMSKYVDNVTSFQNALSALISSITNKLKS